MVRCHFSVQQVVDLCGSVLSVSFVVQLLTLPLLTKKKNNQKTESSKWQNRFSYSVKRKLFCLYYLINTKQPRLHLTYRLSSVNINTCTRACFIFWTYLIIMLNRLHICISTVTTKFAADHDEAHCSWLVQMLAFSITAQIQRSCGASLKIMFTSKPLSDLFQAQSKSELSSKNIDI